MVGVRDFTDCLGSLDFTDNIFILQCQKKGMDQKTLDAITAEMQSWADREYRKFTSLCEGDHRVDYLVGEGKDYRGKVVGLNKVLESIAKKEKLQYNPITLDEKFR